MPAARRLRGRTDARRQAAGEREHHGRSWSGPDIAVMHAGWPLADEMVFMLHQFPRVYAEVGLLQWTDFIPRAEYYSFLERLVNAGFSDRILFGSDASLSEGIDAILDADFLTESQKRDILCNNAARFLRLDEDICTENER